MNKARKKEIEAIVTSLREAADRLMFVRDEEEEAFNNLPEGIQAGERGSEMEEKVSSMDDAISSIEEAIESIEML